MDKLDSKNQTLKITFLEINPPINELIKGKEEINIIFQGNDNFYDFKKYLSSKIPIKLISYKNSLIMTLLKSNNIFATGLFTLRQGEQNVILNYENKKKIISTKTVNINNLLECIKIKIFCEFDNLKNNNKDKENILFIINNKINENVGKYVPKVNLMKVNHLNKNKNNNNNIIKKPFDKKKKYLGNFYVNNSIKKNFNISQEVYLGGEYSTSLTEEMNYLKQSNNNTNGNNNEIKKLNPYFSSKMNKNNNLSLKKEIENSSKAKNQNANKAKSKNYFNTIKRQYKTGFGSQIKMNNSTLNIINQNNKIDCTENINLNTINNNCNNPYNNRNILKPTISFNKNNKKITKNNNKIINLNNNKNLISSLDNLISSQIIEHVDICKKNNSNNITNININNIEKNNLLPKNKNLNKNENKKVKLNNVTMNSISTAGTKKNDLEFSINSLQDYEDKNFINKNSLIPFTNRAYERIQHKLSGNNLNYKKANNHKFNKSLCQNSFTEKLFNENGFNLNLNEQNTNSVMCKSYNKLPKNSHKNINNYLKLENYDNNDIYNNINTINNIEEQKIEDINELEDDNINIELENYLKIKEDFNLLYNREYIQQINEDLLKLEIELFYEKMSELFSTYHIQMDQKILENQIIKRDYKKNINNYLLYNKLYNKLQFVKTQQNIKKSNFKDKGIDLDRQNYLNVNTNMNEIDIFKIIFIENNKTEKLKKIVSIILKKNGNKGILDKNHKNFLK